MEIQNTDGVWDWLWGRQTVLTKKEVHMRENALSSLFHFSFFGQLAKVLPSASEILFASVSSRKHELLGCIHGVEVVGSMPR